ncbi:hypothetical protein ID866_2491 [Astraeus odoratus]|nr:hypothetical protein ID866_2491 [Astraeus odoratus]
MDPATAKKILQELIKREDLNNRCCADCGNPNPQWASGTLLTRTSRPPTQRVSQLALPFSYASNAPVSIEDLAFVRSVSMDTWSNDQIRRMQLGGNVPFKEFLQSYTPADQGGYKDGMSSYDLYHCWAATQYRDKVGSIPSCSVVYRLLSRHQLDCELAGRPWSSSAPPAGQGPSPARPASAQGLRKSRASARSTPAVGSFTNSPLGASPHPSSDGSRADQKSANEAYFAALGQANAARPVDLPPSQGGRYQGFGNTPSPLSSQHPSFNLTSAATPSFADFQDNPAAALGKGWSLLSAAVSGASRVLTENVIQPGMERVRDPNLHATVRGYVSEAQRRAQLAGQSANEWSKSQLGVDVTDRVEGIVGTVRDTLGSGPRGLGYDSLTAHNEGGVSERYHDDDTDDFFHEAARLDKAGVRRRLYHASIIPSLVSTSSPEFRQKAESMDALVADLNAKLAHARQGGGPKAAERMQSRGKKLPRERLSLLLDPDTPFLELSPLAAHDMYPGGAYVPAMADENIIAATGEEVDEETLGGGQMHSCESGVTDHLARDDEHAIAIARGIIGDLGTAGGRTIPPSAPPDDPLYPASELHGIVGTDLRQPFDMRDVIARIVDGSRFREFKKEYGPTIVTVNGPEVIARVLINRCPGYMVGSKAEKAGIAKDGAKMVRAVACANVPKLTVIVGGSFGAGNYGMAGRAYSPRFLWMWPNAKVSVMGSGQLSQVMATVSRDLTRLTSTVLTFMTPLNRLSEETRAKLRSTQVLTSLPQIVSELLQNSIDSGASQIDVGVDCENWSCWVRDDGSGFSKDGLAEIARGSEDGRYMSSKAHTPASLESISTFGFRGEDINRHPISYCDLHKLIDLRFSSSSFAKHAYDEEGETTLRPGIRRSPLKGEKKPVYVLNLTIPPRHIDNCLEPAKTAVLLDVSTHPPLSLSRQ